MTVYWLLKPTLAGSQEQNDTYAEKKKYYVDMGHHSVYWLAIQSSWISMIGRKGIQFRLWFYFEQVSLCFQYSAALRRVQVFYDVM